LLTPSAKKLLQTQEKCLMHGFTDGEKAFCRNINRKMRGFPKNGASSQLARETKTLEKGVSRTHN
jgi:hypothetical protein